MHRAIRKATETEALQNTSESLRGIGSRLDAIEGKLDRVLAMLEQPRPAPVPQQQKGGR